MMLSKTKFQKAKSLLYLEMDTLIFPLFPSTTLVLSYLSCESPCWKVGTGAFIVFGRMERK